MKKLVIPASFFEISQVPYLIQLKMYIDIHNFMCKTENSILEIESEVYIGKCEKLVNLYYH